MNVRMPKEIRISTVEIFVYQFKDKASILVPSAATIEILDNTGAEMVASVAVSPESDGSIKYESPPSSAV